MSHSAGLTAVCRARGVGPKCARDRAAATAPSCSNSEPNPRLSAKAKAWAGWAGGTGKGPKDQFPFIRKPVGLNQLTPGLPCFKASLGMSPALEVRLLSSRFYCHKGWSQLYLFSHRALAMALGRLCFRGERTVNSVTAIG